MITFDNKTQDLIGTGNISFSHTVGFLQNRLLVVGFLVRSDTTTLSAVTYGGVSMTQATRVSDATNIISVEIWYLFNPASGANTLAATVSASPTEVRTIAVSFRDSTNSPLGTVSGSAGTTSATLVSTESNQLLISFAINEDGTLPIVGSGETDIYMTDEGVWSTAAEYAIKGPAGSQTLDYTGWADAQGCSAAASFFGSNPSFKEQKLRPAIFSPGVAR